jgi:hypothetical protein
MKCKTMQGMEWHDEARHGMACNGKAQHVMEWKGKERKDNAR